MEEQSCSPHSDQEAVRETGSGQGQNMTFKDPLSVTYFIQLGPDS
jgi:hypothetical protein